MHLKGIGGKGSTQMDGLKCRLKGMGVECLLEILYLIAVV